MTCTQVEMVRQVIAQLQERAESENKMAIKIERDSNGKTLYLARPLYSQQCLIENSPRTSALIHT